MHGMHPHELSAQSYKKKSVFARKSARKIEFMNFALEKYPPHLSSEIDAEDFHILYGEADRSRL
jgi:hypothetical protein